MLLNARTGELIIDDETLNDSQVLQVIADHFNLLPGTEQFFTLHTFKRLFQLYPALTYLNGYAEAFLEQAKSVKPRFQVVGPAANEDVGTDDLAEMHYDSLELAKRVTIRISEMARVSSEIVQVAQPKGVVNINGEQTKAFTIQVEYEDKPSFDTNEDVDLSGFAKGSPTSYGLDMDRLPKLMHLRISLPGTTYTYVREFANENRTQLDHTKMIEVTVTQQHHGISLFEAINAVLYSINLEEEDDYLAERAMLDEMLADLDLNGLPILTLPGEDEMDEGDPDQVE